MPRPTPFSADPWPARMSEWAEAWGVPGLAERVTIKLSARMRVSLGRCAPMRREVRVANFLLEGPEALLEEVLCHELAHVAVAELHGAAVAAHGPEWRGLMTRVGRAPRARIPAAELERAIPVGRSARVLWEHRCPVCQAKRNAGRPVKNWRCSPCRRVGLTGRLIITRMGREARGSNPHASAPG